MLSTAILKENNKSICFDFGLGDVSKLRKGESW